MTKELSLFSTGEDDKRYRDLPERFLRYVELENAQFLERLCACGMLHQCLIEFSKMDSNYFSESCKDDLIKYSYTDDMQDDSFAMSIMSLIESWPNDLEYALVERCREFYQESKLAVIQGEDEGDSAYDVIYRWLEGETGIKFL